MSVIFDRIEQDALALSPQERAELVGKLWESLDFAPYPKLSPEWRAEIERRRREILEGKVKPVPGEDVSRKARELAGRPLSGK